MGALRASELDGFGMIGVGKIYACFKQGLIEADDEVAVAYNPVTFAPVSDPLVNIRFALHSLVQTGVVDTGTSDALLESSAEHLLPGTKHSFAFEHCRTTRTCNQTGAYRDRDFSRDP